MHALMPVVKVHRSTSPAIEVWFRFVTTHPPPIILKAVKGATLVAGCGNLYSECAFAVSYDGGNGKECWSEILPDHYGQGMKIAPQLAVGGASQGFFTAKTEVFPGPACRGIGFTYAQSTPLGRASK